jgi:hypothetical protein
MIFPCLRSASGLPCAQDLEVKHSEMHTIEEKRWLTDQNYTGWAEAATLIPQTHRRHLKSLEMAGRFTSVRFWFSHTL